MAAACVENRPEQSPALSWRWSLGLLILACGVRGAALFGGAPQLAADPDGYRELALAVVDYGCYGYPPKSAGVASAAEVQPTAYRPPLYPLLLTLGGWWDRAAPRSVAVLHLLLGVGTVALTDRLGRQWRLGLAGWTAAVFTACDPLLVKQSTLVMTETLATFLAVAGLWALARWQPGNSGAGLPTPWRGPHAAAGIAGGLLALAALCRPTFLVWLAAVTAVRLLPAIRTEHAHSASPRCNAAHAWSELACCLLAAVLVLAPWSVRNAVALGRPVWSTTHGGYTLWLANNEAYYRFLREAPWGATWDSRDLDQQYSAIRGELGDIAADRWAREQAAATIRLHPQTFAYATAVRLGSLWGVLPHQVVPQESAPGRWLRYGVAVWYAAVFALALVGSWRLGKRLWQTPWLWGVLLVVSFSAVHAFYWTNLRMRAPLMPVVYLAATVGVAALTRRATVVRDASAA